MVHRKQDLVAYATSLGFDRVGVASAQPLVREGAALHTWLAQGCEGDMIWMRRNPERRADPGALLAGAKSVVMLAAVYGNDGGEVEALRGREKAFSLRRHVSTSPQKAQIARYARGPDYHTVLGKRLEALVRYMDMLYPGETHRTFLDTGPLLERGFAQRAGLGFIGKNTLLIARGLGSYVFLAGLVTTADLEPDPSDLRSCGSCRLCLDACPTQAFNAPFELDARKCIAYLTIEKRGDIDPEWRGKTGGWVFGCDVCQDVCPHNRVIHPSSLGAEGDDAAVSSGEGGLRLEFILDLKTEHDFKTAFHGAPILRAGREGLVRNACLAAANLGRYDVKPLLERLMREDLSLVVREHARWALDRLSRPLASRARMA